MVDIALDERLMHIAALLFGATIYLFLLVSILYRVSGGRLPSGNKNLGWLKFTAFFGFATLAVAASLLPDSTTPSASGTGRIALAPVLLPIFVLFFVGYVYWAIYELFRTVRWLRRGRPKVT